MSDIEKSKFQTDPNLGENSGFAQTMTNGWRIISVKTRVDSFNQSALMEEIRELAAQGCNKMALDLKGNRFMSLPAIKFCVEVAEELGRRGGQFALVSCPEKTKRHFEIYGSLDRIKVFRTIAQLPNSSNKENS